MLDDEIKSLIQEKIKEYDENFYFNEYKKDNSNLVFKGYMSRTILYKDMKLKIRIRYYRDTKNNKNIYPVYEKYEIEKRYFYNKKIRKNIAKNIIKNNISFQAATDIIDGFKISKSSVRRYVQEFHYLYKYEHNIEINPKLFKNIFISIDDTFRNVISNRTKYKYRFRIITIHQGKVNNKFINQIKICISSKVNNNKNNLLYTNEIIKNTLDKYYLANEQNYQIICCGDGAKYIKNIAKNYPDSMQILDKFHCFNNVYKVFNFRKIDRNLKTKEALKLNKFKKNTYKKIINFLEKNKFNSIYKLLEKSEKTFSNNQKIKDVKRLKTYIKNNEKSIKNWSYFDSNPTLTETYVQQILKRYFGNIGKIYSLEILKNIVSNNCYFYAF